MNFVEEVEDLEETKNSPPIVPLAKGVATLSILPWTVGINLILSTMLKPIQKVEGMIMPCFNTT